MNARRLLRLARQQAPLARTGCGPLTAVGPSTTITATRPNRRVRRPRWRGGKGGTDTAAPSRGGAATSPTDSGQAGPPGALHYSPIVIRPTARGGSRGRSRGDHGAIMGPRKQGRCQDHMVGGTAINVMKFHRKQRIPSATKPMCVQVLRNLQPICRETKCIGRC